MRDLVRHHQRNALFVRDRRRFRVDQQIYLAERDAAPVLHRSRGKIGDGEKVEFLERVRNMEEILGMSKRIRKQKQRTA